MAFAFGGTAVVAHAQNQAVPDQVAQQQAASQPGAARVSMIEGNVSIQRADSGEWVAATVNTPLMNGDTISTGPNSRAEVQLDYANVLRLDSNSTAKIANLDRSNIQVQVAQGLANLDVLGQDQAQTEIDTPNVAVHPLGNGEYRIEVDSNAQTLVTVRGGQANVSTPQGSTQVDSGQLITVQGTNNPQYQISTAGPEDAWDQWNINRDRSIQDAQSWHDTNRYYTGTQSLDGYGHWIYIPGYGNVWQPYQSAGWAPYRNGRWVWEPYFGWTWVSYAPWGWAPYHYGRWFFYDSAWCWWPGPVNVYPAYYPVWAPAYVSFFGFGYGGAGFSLSVGFGNVGWIPCGPGDAYFPWYGRGRTFNVINITNINYIQNNYGRDRGFAPLFRGREGYSNYREVLRNSRVRDGVSWMSRGEFGRAPVPRIQSHIRASVFQRGKMFSGRVPVVPTRESLRSINRAPNPDTMRRGIPANQRFFTNGHPAPRLTSFNQQRAQLQRSIQADHNRFGKPAFTSSAHGGAALGTGRPGNRNGAPSRAFVRSGPSAPNFTQTRNGWHSFGRANGPASVNGARTGHGQPNGNFRVNNRAASPAPAQRRGNFRSFSPSLRQSQPAHRNVSPAPSSRPGWKTFSRNPGQARNNPPARGGAPAPANRQGGGRFFTPSSHPASPFGGRQVQRGRQPLNLRQPIVRRRNPGPQQTPHHFNSNSSPRNFGGPRNSGGPVYRGGPAFGGGQTRRGGNAPSYRAPMPRRSFGGGGMNRGGGGGFSRGGGMRSAPQRRSGGGSHPSGGHGHGR